MRFISCFNVIQRLLLLFAVIVICYFIISYVQFTSQPVQYFNLDRSTSLHSSEWRDSREPPIDPESLLDSPLISHSANEQLRVAVYKRLSSKLARYAHTHGSTSPADVNKIPSQIVSNQNSVQPYHSRIVTPKDSRDKRVGAPNTEKIPSKAGVSSRGNTATLAINPNPSHASTQSPHQLSTVGAPFTLSHNYQWPQPRAVRAVTDMMTEQWMADLQGCLKRVTSHEVTLLTSNQPYTEVLLNWLISAVVRASLDLSQVIVIAMDQSLHSLLVERGINSVLVRPASLLTASALKEGVFPTVMMTRLSIIRLLNHWGYDVFNYDTDAVLLRDPTHLIAQHSADDIIGTFGRFPTDLTKKWGITLCTALLVVRSSKATEKFWEAVSRTAPNSYSDQGKVNYGLQAMDVEWSLPSKKLSSLSHPVQGLGHNGLRVSLLPYNIACRAGSCTRKALASGLYIWHKGGTRTGPAKRVGAEEGGVWFLRSDWTMGCDQKTGGNWVQCIAVANVL